ncbi:hypothetical protein ACWNT8_09015 [Pigmentibacter ruber]
MKLNNILILLTLIPTFSTAKEYICPALPAGNYVSVVDTLNDWYIYATEKNNNTTKMDFKVNNITHWNKLSIEPLQDLNGTYINLITCSSTEENFYAHIMLTVPESNCYFKDKNTFNCY